MRRMRNPAEHNVARRMMRNPSSEVYEVESVILLVDEEGNPTTYINDTHFIKASSPERARWLAKTKAYKEAEEEYGDALDGVVIGDAELEE